MGSISKQIQRLGLATVGAGLLLLPMVCRAQTQPPFFTGKTLALPCRNPLQNANSCNAILPLCSTVKSEISNAVGEYAETLQKHAYTDRMLINLEESTLQKKVGDSLGVVCQPWKNNEISSQAQYGMSASCGRPALVGPDLRVLVPPDSNFISYWLGLHLAYKGCYAQQVKNEIDQGELRISMPCAGIAEDIKNLYTQVQNTGNTYLHSIGQSVQNLCQQKEHEANPGINLFAICNEVIPPTEESHDHVKRRSIACSMAAASTEIAQAFKHLARCEVAARSEYSSDRNLYGKEPGSAWDRFQNEFSIPLANRFADRARACTRRLLPNRIIRCIERLIPAGNTEFQNGLPEEFKRLFEHFAPANGRCQAKLNSDQRQPISNMPLNLYFLGFTLLNTLPASRKKRALKSLPILMLLHLSACCQGSWESFYRNFNHSYCGEGSPGELTMAEPEDCLKTPMPHCGTVSRTGVTVEQNKAIDAISRASISLNAVSERAGGVFQNTLGPQQTAAIDGGAIRTTPSNRGSNSANSNLPSTSKNSGQQNLGAGGTPAGNLTGGQVETQMRTDATPQESALSNLKSDSSEAITKGGKGKSVAAGSKYPNFFKKGLGSGVETPSDTIEFESARSPAKTPDSEKEDPADYFSRIGIEWNLFKIIERRYQREAGTWAVQDARNAAGK